MIERKIEVDSKTGKTETTFSTLDSNKCGLLNKHPCMIMYHPMENQANSRLSCVYLKGIEWDVRLGENGFATCLFHESEEDIRQREEVIRNKS